MFSHKKMTTQLHLAIYFKFFNNLVDAAKVILKSARKDLSILYIP